ncbi:hypothetical protein [Anaeromyxobacter sp. Fw109-5]|uniref:hypothetical protein n=1 Tax=Anaeromyxobacter sp. (strain Fw109-5) TaxID=404589 RepID=UPI0000ED6DBF|nr:hypothetical protein [Anaeromyxobacter sp. Fw109-5]ABS28458.1 hypothetical protein Anae109_4280 [Anaeromyxobacter sp. Fw109-5]
MGRVRDALLAVLGDVKVFRWPMWIVYDPGSYRVKGRDMRAVIERVRPGDVLVRGFDAYLDGKLIPGLFSHVGLFLGRTGEVDRAAAPPEHREGFAVGEQTVIHAIAEGVVTEDVLDFCRCDRLAVLRFPAQLRARPGAPPDDPRALGEQERALRDRLVAGGDVAFEEAWPVVRREALAQVGVEYDFDLDFRDLRRLSCTELVHRATRCLAPFLGVQPRRHRILGISGVGIVPDAFVRAPLELVCASHSVDAARLGALRPAEPREGIERGLGTTAAA